MFLLFWVRSIADSSITSAIHHYITMASLFKFNDDNHRLTSWLGAQQTWAWHQLAGSGDQRRLQLSRPGRLSPSTEIPTASKWIFWENRNLPNIFIKKRRTAKLTWPPPHRMRMKLSSFLFASICGPCRLISPCDIKRYFQNFVNSAKLETSPDIINDPVDHQQEIRT